MDEPLVTPNIVLANLAIFQRTLFYNAVGLTWIIYDWGIILPREVKYFWKGPFTLTHFIYFSGRFTAFSSLLVLTTSYFRPSSTKFCLFALYYGGFTPAFQIWSLWSILTLRLHALYRNRKILISMVVLAVLSGATMASIAVKSIIRVPLTNEPFPGVFFCSIQPQFDHLTGLAWTWWVPILLFEIYLFFLALMQLVRHLRHIKKQALISARPRYLIEVILRDSIWYFASVIAVDSAAWHVYEHPSAHILLDGSFWAINMFVPYFAFVTSRMCFDLLELKRTRVVGTGVSGLSQTGLDEETTSITFRGNPIELSTLSRQTYS